MKYWIILVLVVLVGCGDEATSTTPPEETVIPTVVAVEAPLVIEKKFDLVKGSLDGKLITLHTTGGIAGIDRVTTINYDGTVTITETIGGTTTERQAHVTAEEIGKLEQLLNGEEFRSLDAQYLPEQQCCDLMRYELITPSQIISTMDGSTYPPVLNEVFMVIGQLTAQAK